MCAMRLATSATAPRAQPAEERPVSIEADCDGIDKASAIINSSGQLVVSLIMEGNHDLSSDGSDLRMDVVLVDGLAKATVVHCVKINMSTQCAISVPTARSVLSDLHIQLQEGSTAIFRASAIAGLEKKPARSPLPARSPRAPGAHRKQPLGPSRLYADDRKRRAFNMMTEEQQQQASAVLAAARPKESTEQQPLLAGNKKASADADAAAATVAARPAAKGATKSRYVLVLESRAGQDLESVLICIMDTTNKVIVQQFMCTRNPEKEGILLRELPGFDQKKKIFSKVSVIQHHANKGKLVFLFMSEFEHLEKNHQFRAVCNGSFVDSVLVPSSILTGSINAAAPAPPSEPADAARDRDATATLVSLQAGGNGVGSKRGPDSLDAGLGSPKRSRQSL
ncbi:Hypothetical Protein FCC1311_037152 [Hondaea fermentalgiana]|uniref:Uncharacterized protein n=1 Tax=Hondaea fermentalgiana TaxID=2315210 RepID=A0A2R5G8W0_9STRA|nr:Hypothetical Protein FCC1311_037152 [Hondaea fermentalgiana]|eukprot:GBG27492.1 Hypothetical Protein FCC1311_037152 [Hondaea fermentalgiana]